MTSTADPLFSTEKIAIAASSWLATLDSGQRAKAVFSFSDEQRQDWHFVPRPRKGLPFKEMSVDQRAAAHRLMQESLSREGYLKVTSIIHLEEILGEIEDRAQRRDPELYYVTVFGEPWGPAAWGWRLEGHHVSMNFTIVGSTLQPTPMFLGSNPATVQEGRFAGSRVLAGVEDRARDLLLSLTQTQRTSAMIGEEAPPEITTGNSRRVQLSSSDGIKASEMTPHPRVQLVHLLGEYLANLAPTFADAQMAKILESGIDELRFAWAGGAASGQGHYYRVHGPTVLVEYDNTQNGANHIHSVWRDLENDFGDGLC